MVGEEQIVVCGKRNVLPASVAKRDVAVRVTEIRCLRKIVEPYARVADAGDQCHGAVGAAVGNDQQLEVGFGLIENGLNRQPDHVCPVVRRQEDADARHPTSPWRSRTNAG